MIIVIMSVIIWWAIDQAKRLYPVFRIPDGAGKIITVAIAIVAGGLFAWAYGLDLFVALGLFDAVSVGGQVCAAIAMAAGSSAIYELIDKVQQAKGAG